MSSLTETTPPSVKSPPPPPPLSEVDVDILVSAGTITASFAKDMKSTILKKSLVKPPPSKAPTEADVDAMVAKGTITASFAKDMKSTIMKKSFKKPPFPKETTEVDVDRLLAEGSIDSTMARAMKSAMKGKKSVTPLPPKKTVPLEDRVTVLSNVPGKISSITADSEYWGGYVDVGRKQKATFKIGECYDDPKLDQFVKVTLHQSAYKLWCTDVTFDFHKEGLLKAADKIYDLTGGVVSLDPTGMDDEGMEALLSTVMSLTKVEKDRRKKAIKDATAALKTASRGQIAFLMDCTGSMSSYITTAKQNIERLRDEVIMRAPASAALSFAFVGYRDFDTTNPPVLTFTENPQAFATHLESISAKGGGDECEDVLSGLMAVADLAWESSTPTKILFHVADAPCHGSYFDGGNRYGDDRTDEDSDGSKTKALLQQICSDNAVQYIFLKINTRTTDMINTYNKLLKLVPGKPHIVTQDLADAGDIITIAVDSCVASMSSEFTKASFAVESKSRSTFYTDVTKAVTDKTMESRVRLRTSDVWENMSTVSEGSEDSMMSDITIGSSAPSKREGAVVVLTESLLLPAGFSISDLKKPLKLTKQKVRNFILDDKNVWEKGGCREVSFATDVTFKDEIEYVLKMHLPIAGVLAAPLIERANTIGDLQCQAVSAFLAQTFSALPAIKAAGKKVHYLKSQMVRLKAHNGTMRHGSIERVLKGEFIKHCTNGSWSLGSEDPDFSATLAAFTHWTYEVSGNYLMVVDIQGIKVSDSEFVLTDPAIHCSDENKFGMLNWSQTGFKNFLGAHACNGVCKALRLKPTAKKSIVKGTLGVA